MTQKELAGKLDTAAAKAAAEGRTPATSKQCWYLAGLLLKKGYKGLLFVDSFNQALTSITAHNYIEQLTGGTKKAV